MERNSNGFPAILILYIFLLVGYIMNVVKLIGCDFEPNYKAEIVYGVGTVTGLGGILGWFNFGK